MFRNIAIIFLIFFAASCQSKVGNPLTVNLYKANIDKGSSLDQITKIYGNYSDNWQDQAGNNVYQYSYSRSKYDLVSQLPLINHFGWVKSENYEVLLIVDSSDKLIAEQKFYNQAKSRNSLICNPEIYSCLRKIY
jgi:hypothetical protein